MHRLLSRDTANPPTSAPKGYTADVLRWDADERRRYRFRSRMDWCGGAFLPVVEETDKL